MRAVELKRPLIFSTNDGVTASVDQQGEVKKMISPLSSGVLETRCSPVRGLTFYARFGTVPIWTMTFIFLAYGIIVQIMPKK